MFKMEISIRFIIYEEKSLLCSREISLVSFKINPIVCLHGTFDLDGSVVSIILHRLSLVVGFLFLKSCAFILLRYHSKQF